MRFKGMFICIVLGLYSVFQTIQAQPNPCNCDPLNSTCLATCDIHVLSLAQVVKQSENTLLSIYPNPVFNELNIQAQPNDLLNLIEVYSIKGVLLWKNELNKAAYLLTEISEFDKGIYVLRIVSEKSHTQKMILKL